MLLLAPSFPAVTPAGERGLEGYRSLGEDGSGFPVSCPTLGLVEAKRFRSADPAVPPLPSISEYLRILLWCVHYKDITY